MTGTLTGRGVLFWLLGFFGVIMAMNAYYITVSVRTFRGEDEQLPYLQGVTYNATLARRAQQDMLSWRADVTATRLPQSGLRLRLQVRDDRGAAVTGLKLSGILRHPADEHLDQALSLQPSAPGIYEAELARVTPGAWNLAVRAADRPFETENRLWLP